MVPAVLMFPADLKSVLRSFPSTATNATPHEVIFAFNRNSPNVLSLPVCLIENETVVLLNSLRNSEHDKFVREVQVKEVYLTFARVEFPVCRESHVSWLRCVFKWYSLRLQEFAASSNGSIGSNVPEQIRPSESGGALL